MLRNDIDITGKIVIVKAETVQPEYRSLAARRFRAEGGFGCQPNALGTKVFGTWLDNGEQGYVRRYDIEALGTEGPLFEVVGEVTV
jgi:hypothetical protein